MNRSPSVSSITSGTSAPVNHCKLRHDSFDDRRADRVWLQQHVAERKKLKQSLPVAVKWIFETIIEPLFPPGEPFDEYMRKVAVLTYGAMSCSSPATAIWMLTAASTDDYGWNSKRTGCFIVAVHVSLHLFLFNYFYIRRTTKCPIWLTNLSVFGAELALLLMTLFIPAIDCRSMSLSSLLLVSLMSIKLFPLHAAIHGVIYALHYFRDEYKDSIPALVFSWDKDEFPMSEKILFTFYSFFPQLMAVLGLFVIISGYIKRSKEAQVTNVMTITIADQLQRYDTAAVGATIVRNKDQVSEKLLDAFDAIRTNLESYRPHIPRYLIDAAVERAEDAEARELKALAESEQATEQSGLESDDEGSIASSAQCDRSLSASESMCMSGSRRHINRLRTPTAMQLEPVSSPSGVGNNSQSAFNGIVTSVYLRVVDYTQVDVESTVQTINNAVEAINVIAAATSASVHHIEQGVMLATWNATKRTGNHEIRACTFAAKALAALREFDSLKDCAAAAVLSCKATAHFAGTSQMHFMLSHENTQRHMDLLAIAQKHKTVVCSPSIVRNAEMQFFFLGFSVDCKEKLVYELVESRATSGEDEDEWLYAINTQETDAMSPYSRVTTAAAKALLSAEELAMAKNLPGVHLEENEVSKELNIDTLPDVIGHRSTVKSLQSHLRQ